MCACTCVCGCVCACVPPRARARACVCECVSAYVCTLTHWIIGGFNSASSSSYHAKKRKNTCEIRDQSHRALSCLRDNDDHFGPAIFFIQNVCMAFHRIMIRCGNVMSVISERTNSRVSRMNPHMITTGTKPRIAYCILVSMNMPNFPDLGPRNGGETFST